MHKSCVDMSIEQTQMFTVVFFLVFESCVCHLMPKGNKFVQTKFCSLFEQGKECLFKETLKMSKKDFFNGTFDFFNVKVTKCFFLFFFSEFETEVRYLLVFVILSSPWNSCGVWEICCFCRKQVECSPVTAEQRNSQGVCIMNNVLRFSALCTLRSK